MYLIGYDVGSSSVKAAIVEAYSKKTIAIAQYPAVEMTIDSPQPGWAEQHPDDWWENIQKVTKKVLVNSGIASNGIQAIGISYQMHGLVIIDEGHTPLRPAIIWCDSRAVEIGDKAFESIGKEQCLHHLLNSPGNFTASKLKWVQENEPRIYERIYKVMLPGDYIAMKMTGEITTTISGLSEGIFWDFRANQVSDELTKYYGIDTQLLPGLVDTFSHQGALTLKSAKLLGLHPGIAVGYRAGDQPNNALSLKVLEPGEVAATGGTSGVVYGIHDQPVFDIESRVNPFAHVNHSPSKPRIGVLLCVNGAGILFSWLRKLLHDHQVSYQEMENAAQEVPVGADGLQIIPFGNGAERILLNRNPGASILNLDFNRHGAAHLYRAALEGIAYAFIYGIEIMQSMGINTEVIKVGNDNLFQSRIFAEAIANILRCRIEVMDTTGAVGAAKGAGIGVGIFQSIEEAFGEMKPIRTHYHTKEQLVYQQEYKTWTERLKNFI